MNTFYHEFGLASIHATGRNAYLIIFARTFRMFAYGTNALILGKSSSVMTTIAVGLDVLNGCSHEISTFKIHLRPTASAVHVSPVQAQLTSTAIFFSALDYSDRQIGAFMTLTLLGDVFLGTFLTLVADRIGRRRVLLAGSCLMISSGVIFALFENYWILLGAAIFGVISVTGGDFGPFRSIEESMLSHLTTPETRSDVLAWYVTISTLGLSLGSEVSGRLVTDSVESYHSLFWIYTAMGVLNVILVLLMTEDCETKITASKWGIPSMSTRSIMYSLWFLLSVDSLADGMVPYSLTNYYMDRKFHPAKSTLGDVTSVSYFAGAIGAVFAGPLAKKIGLINTMVFTHVPSSASVLIFPLPSVFWMTAALLLVRAGLNNMDQAPRAAFIAAVVSPEERTAVMGITSMLRTISAMTGPSITGLLAGENFWVAFVIAGLCRLGYDVGLYAMFVNTKLHEHEPANNREPEEAVMMDDISDSDDEARDENQNPPAP